jgi:hypothetical protein
LGTELLHVTILTIQVGRNMMLTFARRFSAVIESHASTSSGISSAICANNLCLRQKTQVTNRNKALYEVQIGRGSVGVWNGSPDYWYCPYAKYTISLFEDI